MALDFTGFKELGRVTQKAEGEYLLKQFNENHLDRMTQKERSFVDNLLMRNNQATYSEKQLAWLRDLVTKYV